LHEFVVYGGGQFAAELVGHDEQHRGVHQHCVDLHALDRQEHLAHGLAGLQLGHELVGGRLGLSHQLVVHVEVPFYRRHRSEQEHKCQSVIQVFQCVLEGRLPLADYVVEGVLGCHLLQHFLFVFVHVSTSFADFFAVTLNAALLRHDAVCTQELHVLLVLVDFGSVLAAGAFVVGGFTRLDAFEDTQPAEVFGI